MWAEEHWGPTPVISNSDVFLSELYSGNVSFRSDHRTDCVLGGEAHSISGVYWTVHCGNRKSVPDNVGDGHYLVPLYCLSSKTVGCSGELKDTIHPG